MTQQMTFWDHCKTEEDCVWEELGDLKNQQHNLRRGLFSRYEKMRGELSLLKEEIITLRNLVDGKNTTEYFELDFYRQAK